MEFLESKSIFIIGALGFLAKILIEKILRTQPNVKKLYLLVRSANEITATQRFYNEVVDKDLFRVLKEKWGEDLNTFISDKICLVPGDISQPNLGLKNSNILEQMKNEVEIIINLAATTTFDERYDVAFSTNTLGPKHLLSFAKQCSNLKILVHVSTAYVSGEKKGLIFETPYEMDESLNSRVQLNIESEREVIKKTLNDFNKKRSTIETTTLAMKHLGLKRAMMYGWPNTYVFTKAMGEMVIDKLKGNLPLVIIRPTMITSTYKEPFPGWMEGVRTVDGIIAGYGRGKLTRLPINTILDVIPADVVVNAIIMSVIVQKSQSFRETTIYHVGSSARNCMRSSEFVDFMFQYFNNKPWINRDGDVVKVNKLIVYNSIASFHRHMTNHHLVLLKVMKFANDILCHIFQDKVIYHQRNFDWAMRLVELYRPYLFLKARFDDSNLERLRNIVTQDKDINIDTLFTDPSHINWEDYFINIHIPGLVKYCIK